MTGEYSFLASAYGSSNAISVNFGQKPFKFAPPDGYQLLTGSSLRPEKVIPVPDQYFDVLTYTGTGATQTFNTLNFGPDLVWIKRISSGTASHVLNDTVRGAGEQLRSDTTDGESTNTNNFAAFTSDGFTIGTGSGTNSNTNTHVAWTWRAGGSKNTFNIDDVGYASAAAAGLDGGSITPTGASVGTKQGFSIIAYTGDNASSATISHGLLQAPKFIIIKVRNTSDFWPVYHHSLGTNHIKLNDTAGSGVDLWGTEPTSSVFSIGTGNEMNAAYNYIAYLWCNVPGLQKFGSYEGNNDNNGVFVELGFKPSILLSLIHI